MNGVQITSWQALGAEISATTKRMLAWVAANPISWVAGFALALMGVAKIYHELNDARIDDDNSIISKANENIQAYDEEISSLEELKGKLQDAKGDRKALASIYTDLNKEVTNATDVLSMESGAYDSANKQIQARINLLKQQREEEQKIKINAERDKFENTGTNVNLARGNSKYTDGWIVDGFVLTLDEMIEKYRRATETIELLEKNNIPDDSLAMKQWNDTLSYYQGLIDEKVTSAKEVLKITIDDAFSGQGDDIKTGYLEQYLSDLIYGGNTNLDDISNKLKAFTPQVEEFIKYYDAYSIATTDDSKKVATDNMSDFLDKIKKDFPNATNLIDNLNSAWQSLISGDGKYSDSNTVEDTITNVTGSLESLTKVVDDLQSAYSTLTSAVEEYNSSGYLSVDSMQSLLNLSPEYLSCLTFENGQLKLNTDALYELTAARIEEMAIRQSSDLVDSVIGLKDEKAQLDRLNVSLGENTDLLWQQVEAKIANAEADGTISASIAQQLRDKIKQNQQLVAAAKAGIGKGGESSSSTKKTADDIAKTNKQLDDLAKSEALDVLKYKFDVIEAVIEKINTAISLLDDTLNNTNDNDYIGKIEVTTEQLDLTQQKTIALANEFSQLNSAEYTSGDAAEELANRMKSVADEIGESQKKIIEYGQSLTEYYTSALTNISSMSNASISKTNDLIERNIQTLSQGGLTGLQFNLMPTSVPQSAIEKQRKENQTLENMMQAYYENVAKMQSTALDMQYKEQMQSNAEKRQELLNSLNEQQKVVNTHLETVETAQKTSNKETSKEQKRDFTEKINETKVFATEVQNIFNQLNNHFKENPIKPTIDFSTLDDFIDKMNNTGKRLTSTAKGLTGTPYVWGGDNPTEDGGLDCSGFVQYVYKQNGIDIPRTAKAQFNSTQATNVVKSDLKEGDLIFFNTDGSGVSHVGMYIGNGKMIHSPTEGQSVKEEDISSFYWQSKYVGAKRMYATGTKPYGVAGENYKTEYAINKKTGEWSVIDSPTLFDRNEYDIVGEKVSEKIDKPIPTFATGTPIKDADVLAMIKRASEATGVPANILLSVIDQESGNKWNKGSWDVNGNSYGYMQLHDTTGYLESLPNDLKQLAKTDPATNIMEGAKFLASLYDSTGNWADATSAYNQGLGNFHKNGRNSYGNEVVNRANSQAFVDMANRLSGIEDNTAITSSNTSSIANIDFKSQLMELSKGNGATSLEDNTNYQNDIVKYIKDNYAISEKSNEEYLNAWNDLANRQMEAQPTLDEFGKVLEDTRYTDDYNIVRDGISDAVKSYSKDITLKSLELQNEKTQSDFNQANDILNGLFKYYQQRKNGNANATELQTIIDAISEQQDNVNELSNAYVEAIQTETEYLVNLGENQMKAFDDQLTWIDNANDVIDRQIDASMSELERSQLRQQQIDNIASKQALYQNNKDIAHQNVLDILADKRYSAITSKYNVEDWFDANGEVSARFEQQKQDMALISPEQVILMEEMCQQIAIYKQNWKEADKSSQELSETVSSMLTTDFEARQKEFADKISNSEWAVSMLGEENFDIKEIEYNRQLSISQNLLDEILKEKIDINNAYKTGNINATQFREQLEANEGSLKNQLSSIESILANLKQVKIDALQNQIDDIEEKSSAITDNLQEQVDALQGTKDTLEDEQSEWEKVASAVKNVISEQLESLNDEKSDAEEYWSDMIEAIQDANDETEKNIELNDKLAAREKANAQKTSLIYQNGKLVYTANQSDVQSANRDLADYTRQMSQEEAISLLEEQRDLEIKSYEDRIDALQKYQDKWNEVFDTYTNYANDMMAQEKLGVDYADEVLNLNLGYLDTVESAYYNNQSQIEGYIDKRIDALNDQIKAEEKATDTTVKALNKQIKALDKADDAYGEFYKTIVEMFKSGNTESIPNCIQLFVDNLPSILDGVSFESIVEKAQQAASDANNALSGIGSGNTTSSTGTTSTDDKSDNTPIVDNSNGNSSTDSSTALQQAIQALKNWESESSSTRMVTTSVYDSPQSAWGSLRGSFNDSIVKIGYLQKTDDGYIVKYIQNGDPNRAYTLAQYAKGTDKANNEYAIINDGGGNAGEIVNFRGGEQVIPVDKSISLINGLQELTASNNPLYNALVNGIVPNDGYIVSNNMLSGKNFATPNIANSNVSANNSITFGDINVHGVNDVDGLLDGINKVLPNLTLQATKRK